MTTLADILAAGNGGGLPPVETFNPKDHALLVPLPTYEIAMTTQNANLPPEWQHRLQPVFTNNVDYYGIGADVLTEALPPTGLYQFVFAELPTELAVTVLVISRSEFLTLLPAGSGGAA